jgi:hypothetical protein
LRNCKAFAAVRLRGGGIKLSYAVQGTAKLVAVCAAAWTWRSSSRPLVA